MQITHDPNSRNPNNRRSANNNRTGISWFGPKVVRRCQTAEKLWQWWRVCKRRQLARKCTPRPSFPRFRTQGSYMHEVCHQVRNHNKSGFVGTESAPEKWWQPIQNWRSLNDADLATVEQTGKDWICELKNIDGHYETTTTDWEGNGNLFGGGTVSSGHFHYHSIAVSWSW